MRFDYRVTDTSTVTDWGQIRLRSIAPNDYLFIEVRPAQLRLIKKIGEVWTVLDTASISTVQGQWYTLRAVYEGADVRVWRSAAGELESEVLASGSAAPLTTSAVMLGITSGGATGDTYEFDNVRILADGLSTTTTFAVNDADELVSATDTNGGTTYFEYDAWGRMVRKYMGTSQSPTFEATYEYKYDDKLVAVTSNFPDEGSVSYTYGADGQRRSRTANGVTTKYNWGIDGVMSEEDATGALLSTFIAKIGEVNGSNPASGSYAYVVSEATTSVRAAFDEQGAVVSTQEFGPYGSRLKNLGVTFHWGYMGHHCDDDAGMYILKFRGYRPGLARWLSREPSGLDQPNLYWYCLNNPITFVDLDGRCALVPFVVAGAIAGGLSGAVCGATSNAGKAPRWENVVAGTLIGTITGAMAGLGLGYAATTATLSGAAISIGFGTFAGGATGIVGSGGNVSAGATGALIGGATGGLVPRRSLIDIGYTLGYGARVGSGYGFGLGALCAP